MYNTLTYILIRDAEERRPILSLLFVKEGYRVLIVI